MAEESSVSLDEEKKDDKKKDDLQEVAVVCVYSPKQDAYLVHKRSAEKKVFPGLW